MTERSVILMEQRYRDIEGLDIQMTEFAYSCEQLPRMKTVEITIGCEYDALNCNPEMSRRDFRPLLSK